MFTFFKTYFMAIGIFLFDSFFFLKLKSTLVKIFSEIALVDG